MKRHISPDVLQKLMGHADISTTMKHYTGTTDEDSALGRAALANVFGTKTDAQLTRKVRTGTFGEAPRTENHPGDTINAVGARSSAG